MAISTNIKGNHVHIGDVIKVHQEVVEDEKTRTQIFEGVVIAIKNQESGKSFTVRKIAVGNVGVERIWPVLSPNIKQIEVVRTGKVRRAKLYYLRQGKAKDSLKLEEAEERKPVKSSKKEKKEKKKEKPRAPKKTG